VPDVTAKPGGWATVKQLVEEDWHGGWLMDTGVDSLVIAGDFFGGFQAIDLDAKQMLWSVDGYNYHATFDNGTGVVSSGNELALVDLMTGQVTVLGTYPEFHGVEIFGNNLAVTYDYDYDILCVRLFSDMSTCVWEGHAIAWAPNFFGGGRWLNSSDGVFDLDAIELAPFGADSSQIIKTEESVYYTGDDTGIARISVDSKGVVSYQPWDILLDKATAKQTRLDGFDRFPNYEALPWILTQSGTDSEFSLAAYSYSTNKALWQTPLNLRPGQPGYSFFQHFLQVDMIPGYHGVPSDLPSSAIIDAQSGRVLWEGDGFKAIEAGRRVVYGVDEPASGVLHAFDGQSSGFTELWSIEAPVAAADFYLIANHVVAVSQHTKKIWVLEL